MRDKTEHIVILILTVAALAGGLGFLNAWEGRSEWKKKAERRAEQRDSLEQITQGWKDSASVLKERVEKADSAAEAAHLATERATERADSVVRLLHEAEVALEIEVDSLQGVLIRQIRADMPPIIVENTARKAFQAQQAQVVALRGQIEQKDLIIGAQGQEIHALRTSNTEKDRLLAVKDSTIAAQENDKAEMRRQIAELEDELEPGFFDMSFPRIGRDVALAAVGYVIGSATSN